MLKNRKHKGELGYISYMKAFQLTLTIAVFAVAAGIFVLGLCLNDFDKGNIFTIIAAIFVLPAARALTLFILYFPNKPVSRERYDEVVSLAKPGSIVYTEMLFTTTERTLYMGFVVITGNKVLVMSGKENEDIFKAQEYLGGTVRRKGYDYKVTVVSEWSKFISLIKSSDSALDIKFDSESEKEAFDKERAELCSMLESICA